MLSNKSIKWFNDDLSREVLLVKVSIITSEIIAESHSHRNEARKELTFAIG